MHEKDCRGSASSSPRPFNDTKDRLIEKPKKWSFLLVFRKGDLLAALTDSEFFPSYGKISGVSPDLLFLPG